MPKECNYRILNIGKGLRTRVYAPNLQILGQKRRRKVTAILGKRNIPGYFVALVPNKCISHLMADFIWGELYANPVAAMTRYQNINSDRTWREKISRALKGFK